MKSDLILITILQHKYYYPVFKKKSTNYLSSHGNQEFKFRCGWCQGLSSKPGQKPIWYRYNPRMITFWHHWLSLQTLSLFSLRSPSSKGKSLCQLRTLYPSLSLISWASTRRHFQDKEQLHRCQTRGVNNDVRGVCFKNESQTYSNWTCGTRERNTAVSNSELFSCT